MTELNGLTIDETLTPLSIADILAYADLSSASYKFKEIKLLTLQSTTLQTQLQVSL